MSFTVLAAEGAEKTRDLPLPPYVVGGLSLLLLAVMMLGVLSFGKGREHS